MVVTEVFLQSFHIHIIEIYKYYYYIIRPAHALILHNIHTLAYITTHRCIRDAVQIMVGILSCQHTYMYTYKLYRVTVDRNFWDKLIHRILQYSVTTSLHIGLVIQCILFGYSINNRPFISYHHVYCD